MEQLGREGRHAEVLELDVECRSTASGCNRVHLQRGESCWEVGRMLSNTSLLDCAAEELERGMRLTAEEDWQEEPLRGRRLTLTREKAEALRALLDRASGRRVFDDRAIERADRLAAWLAATAAELERLEGGGDCAIFYAVRVELYRIADHSEAERCAALVPLTARLDQARELSIDEELAHAYRGMRSRLESVRDRCLAR